MQAASPPSESTGPEPSPSEVRAEGDAAAPRTGASPSQRPVRAQHTPAEPKDRAAGHARRGGGPGLWLIALIALGLAGWNGYRLWQQDARTAADASSANELASDPAFRELERRLSQAQQRVSALEARSRDDQAVNEVLREQLLTLSQRQALGEQTLANLAGQSAPSAQPGSLDQAEYLLLAAQARLELFNDLQGATSALRLADRTLASSGDPLASTVRGSIAAELDALAAVPRVDGAALQARLGALFADLPNWPLPGEADPVADQPAPWYRAWLRLDNYLSIRRVAPEAGLDPFLQGATRMGVQAQLALARMLLLQRRHDELPAVLAGLRRSLEAFDGEHPSVAQARAGLDAIAREPFNQPLPQGGLALDELRRLRGLRGTAQPATESGS